MYQELYQVVSTRVFLNFESFLYQGTPRTTCSGQNHKSLNKWYVYDVHAAGPFAQSVSCMEIKIPLRHFDFISFCNHMKFLWNSFSVSYSSWLVYYVQSMYSDRPAYSQFVHNTGFHNDSLQELLQRKILAFSPCCCWLRPPLPRKIENLAHQQAPTRHQSVWNVNVKAVDCRHQNPSDGVNSTR